MPLACNRDVLGRSAPTSCVPRPACLSVPYVGADVSNPYVLHESPFDSMDDEPHRCNRDVAQRGASTAWAPIRGEQRITDPFPVSGRALTCGDVRLANSLLRASAQVAGS